MEHWLHWFGKWIKRYNSLYAWSINLNFPCFTKVAVSLFFFFNNGECVSFISKGKNPTPMLVTNHILLSSHSHVKIEPTFYNAHFHWSTANDWLLTWKVSHRDRQVGQSTTKCRKPNLWQYRTCQLQSGITRKHPIYSGNFVVPFMGKTWHAI